MSSSDRLLFSLVVLSLSVFAVSCDELLLKGEGIDRGAHSDRSGLWFGPRLGKRSSPPVENERDILQRLLEAAANLKYESDLYEQGTQNGFYTPRPGRSEKHREEPRRRYSNNNYEDVDFTPRLGRGLGDLGVSDEELARYYAVKASRLEPDFTPRLGRNLAGYHDSIRVVRSVNKTKS